MAEPTVSHGPACPCPRCRGFEPGNQLSVGNRGPMTHGARSVVNLAPRIAELVDALAPLVPAVSPSDGPTLAVLAGVMARIEAAQAYLDEHGIMDEHGQPRPILKQLSTWENTAVRTLDKLGCTPTARAQLGLDLARTPAAAATALREYLAGGRDELEVASGGS